VISEKREIKLERPWTKEEETGLPEAVMQAKIISFPQRPMYIDLHRHSSYALEEGRVFDDGLQ